MKPGRSIEGTAVNEDEEEDGGWGRLGQSWLDSLSRPIMAHNVGPTSSRNHFGIVFAYVFPLLDSFVLTNGSRHMHTTMSWLYVYLFCTDFPVCQHSATFKYPYHGSNQYYASYLYIQRSFSLSFFLLILIRRRSCSLWRSSHSMLSGSFDSNPFLNMYLNG